MELSPVEQAFADSLLPEGSICTGMVTGLMFIDPDGNNRWRCWADVDLPVSSTLGLLELMKLDMIARSNTGLPITYGDDGG